MGFAIPFEILRNLSDAVSRKAKQMEAYLFWEFFFFWPGCLSAFGSLAFRPGFGFFPWLLGFSVSGLIGHSTSYSFLVLYGLLVSWFPWLLGFSASRLLGLSASYNFVYYIILCYIKLF